jgi:F-type H+-transporting ATPase subunit b
LKEAREMRDKIVGDAKSVADEEAKKLMNRAQDEIEKQKSAAIAEIKREVSVLSVQIAEKLMQQQLENNAAQQGIIENQLSQLN